MWTRFLHFGRLGLFSLIPAEGRGIRDRGGEGVLIPQIVGRGLGPAFLHVDFTGARTFLVRVGQDSWSWFVDYDGPFTRNGRSGEQFPNWFIPGSLSWGGWRAPVGRPAPTSAETDGNPSLEVEMYALHLCF